MKSLSLAIAAMGVLSLAACSYHERTEVVRSEPTVTERTVTRETAPATVEEHTVTRETTRTYP